jgi:hypothetical protein
MIILINPQQEFDNQQSWFKVSEKIRCRRTSSEHNKGKYNSKHVAQINDETDYS